MPKAGQAARRKERKKKALLTAGAEEEGPPAGVPPGPEAASAPTSASVPRDADADASDRDSEDDNPQAPIRQFSRDTFQQYKRSILSDTFHNYYLSGDWSAEFYTELAFEGFIAVSHGEFLLPEIQRSYCVLDFSGLHVAKKTKRLLRGKKLRFCVNRDWDTTVRGIELYWGDKNWFSSRYAAVLKRCGDGVFRESAKLLGGARFLRPHSIELYVEDGRSL